MSSGERPSGPASRCSAARRSAAGYIGSTRTSASVGTVVDRLGDTIEFGSHRLDCARFLREAEERLGVAECGGALAGHAAQLRVAAAGGEDSTRSTNSSTSRARSESVTCRFKRSPARRTAISTASLRRSSRARRDSCSTACVGVAVDALGRDAGVGEQTLAFVLGLRVNGAADLLDLAIERRHPLVACDEPALGFRQFAAAPLRCPPRCSGDARPCRCGSACARSRRSRRRRVRG